MGVRVDVKIHAQTHAQGFVVLKKETAGRPQFNLGVGKAAKVVS